MKLCFEKIINLITIILSRDDRLLKKRIRVKFTCELEVGW